MPMHMAGTARRVRIYLHEDDRSDGKPLLRELVELLRSGGARGATVLRAVEGFGASGRLHGGALVDVAAHLPLVIEWVDAAEQVDRLLPRILERAPHALVTVDETQVAGLEPDPVRVLEGTVSVADAMSRDVLAVEPSTPIREVVELVLGKTYRAVPVTEGGRPVGIITNTDLVERGGLSLRVDLLRVLDKPAVHEALERLSRVEHTAGDVMTRSPVTVRDTAPLPRAAELMARRRLKRLPVVDAAGKLVGIVSRVDLLRRAAGGAPAADAAAQDLGLVRDEPVSRVMRRDVPVVRPETPLSETLQAVVSTRLNRAFVVDADGRVVGLVSDAELLERVTPALRPSALRTLMTRLPFSSQRQDPVGAHARGHTAGDVMTRSFATVAQDVLLSDAIARMLRDGQKVLAVTDGGGRLVGIVDRADLLHGLLPEG